MIGPRASGMFGCGNDCWSGVQGVADLARLLYTDHKLSPVMLSTCSAARLWAALVSTTPGYFNSFGHESSVFHVPQAA